MSERTQEQTCSQTLQTSTLPFPGSDLTPRPPLPPSSGALTFHPDALLSFPVHPGYKSLSFIFLSLSVTGTCAGVVTLLLRPVVTMTLELGGHQCSCSWNAEPAVERRWSGKHSTELLWGPPAPARSLCGVGGTLTLPTVCPGSACHPSAHCHTVTLTLSSNTVHAIFHPLLLPPVFSRPANHLFPRWLKTHLLEESHSQAFLLRAVPWLPPAAICHGLNATC